VLATFSAAATAARIGKLCPPCTASPCVPWQFPLPTNKVVVAGALDGVYRSNDGGNNWQRISPNDGVVKNIESIAVDPKDPNVVYAGTWHLAWKTATVALTGSTSTKA